MAQAKAVAQALVATALMACHVDANDTMVELTHAVAPDTTCLYKVTNDAEPFGYYDPTFDQAGAGYHLVLAVRNDLQARDATSPLVDAKYPLYNKTHNLNLFAIEGCWDQFKSDEVSLYAYAKRGLALDCNALAAQSGSLPIAGEVDQDETEALIGVQVLQPIHLRQIFGDGFDAANLPVVGTLIRTNPAGGDPVTYYSNTTADPGAPGRAAAWGARWPTTRLAPVVLQLRAVGRTQGGELVRSGWFSYLINVCPGCSRDPCGELQVASCFGVCSDGSTCPGTGLCPDNSPCPRRSVLSGKAPDYSGTNICNIAQGYGTPTCTLNVGCTLAP